MNRERAGEHWDNLSRMQKIEYGGGAIVVGLLALCLAIAKYPEIGGAIVLLLLAVPVILAVRNRGQHGVGSRAVSKLGQIAAVLIVLLLVVVLFVKSPLFGILGLVALIAVVIARTILSQHRQHARRMLPNREQALELTHSSHENESEELFDDIFHRIAALANEEPLTAKDREQGRGQISGVFIFTRPDEHGQVRMQTFLAGHEDLHPAEQLEQDVQAVFSGDVTAYPVDLNEYQPVVYSDQWRASQGSDPDRVLDYDPDEIEDLAPPPR